MWEGFFVPSDKRGTEQGARRKDILGKRKYMLYYMHTHRLLGLGTNASRLPQPSWKSPTKAIVSAKETIEI